MRYLRHTEDTSFGDQVCLQFLWGDGPVLHLGPRSPRNGFGHVIHGAARWGEPGHMGSYGSDSATTETETSPDRTRCPPGRRTWSRGRQGAVCSVSPQWRP